MTENFDIQFVYRQAENTSSHFQALQKHFCLGIGEDEMHVTWNIPRVDTYHHKDALTKSKQCGKNIWLKWERPKQVRVKRRLIQLLLQNDSILIIRLQNENLALKSAISMKRMWGIEPEIIIRQNTTMANESNSLPMASIAREYVRNSDFQSTLHACHDRLDTICSIKEYQF